MVERTLIAALVALALAGGAPAAPWNLRCASMPLEQPVPAALAHAARAFWPWGTGVVRGLHAGPVYLLAGSYRTALSRDGDTTDPEGRYLHRALVAVAPTFGGAVTVAGDGFGFSTSGAIRCSVNGNDVTCDTRREPLFDFASRLVVPAGTGWRIVRTELRLPGTGCFELTVAGKAMHDTIPLAVPGPSR